MPRGSIKVLNWNIAGAKYLELKSALKHPALAPSKNREGFRKKLNDVLRDLIRRHKPDIVTLQEVVCYHADGDQPNAEHIIDYAELYDYRYIPHWLIDTQHHSHQGKWNKVREKGEWLDLAFFAQGNAILVSKQVSLFPIWSLPAVGQDPGNPSGRDLMEVVKLESGLYFGDRNTEPRAALVVHLVLDKIRHAADYEQLERPLDLFIVNLHLSTLMMEREGIPDIDDEASKTRLRQMDLVLNGIVSRYNRWKGEGFRIRGEKVDPRDGETHDRHSPIWVIAGDFNFTPESVEYDTMVHRGFIDLIRSHEVGTKTSGLGESPTLTVDYVFGGPRFEAIDPLVASEGTKHNLVEVTDDTRVSDHFPLIVSVPIAVAKP